MKHEAKNVKRVAVIGAGFTGLTAALRLLESGFDVTIYEQMDRPGGLAAGFKEDGWDWPLEDHYHHIFTSDDAILSLAKTIGQPMISVRPITATYYNRQTYQLDSPLSLLTFDPLSMPTRLRTGTVLAFLRINPYWQMLEGITARNFLERTMGRQSWQVLWQPLFAGKFGQYADTLPASWFWARIKKRSATLMYPEGGFQTFANSLANKVKSFGGRIHYQTAIQNINKRKQGLSVTYQSGQSDFQSVICTLPSTILVKMVPTFPNSYREKLSNLQGLGAINLILELQKPFFADRTYWLNVNDTAMPFLCIVEHTNFIDRRHYQNNHIVYVGTYLSQSSPLFSMSENELVNYYLPHLQKINPVFKRDWIVRIRLKRTGFAQPLVPLHYAKQLLPFQTPIANLYMANMQQVYPFDRGTNYAVDLGNRIATYVTTAKKAK